MLVVLNLPNQRVAFFLSQPANPPHSANLTVRKSVMKFARRLLFCLVLLALSPVCLRVCAGDWPQWGGHDDRNMVSSETGLPDSFVPGQKEVDGSAIRMGTTEHVLWAARLGSYSFGNSIVARGRVVVGTDVKTLAADERFKFTKGGLVKCLDASTGKLIWQLITPMRKDLPKAMHFSQQHLGTCSSALIEGDRLYVVTSAAEVLCLDLEGLANGNQGPFTNEAQYFAGEGQPPVTLTNTDADILWRFDPITELGIYIHDAASSSVLMHGDFLYVTLANGVDGGHEKIHAPGAPVLIALDKRTGRLVAKENEGISARLFHAQWSSPSLGLVNGQPLVFLGGGDGVCYAFRALAKAGDGVMNLEKVWSYDCNPPNFRLREGKPIRYVLGDKRRKDTLNQNDGAYVGPCDIIATPVFHQNRVYVAIGQDPAHGRGRGMFHCIDATQTGDITKSGRVWSYDGIERSLASAAVANGLVYVTDLSGKLHCLDAVTGAVRYVYETHAETWGGPLVADGKLYFGNQKGLFIMRAGPEPVLLNKIVLGAAAHSTPVAANGVLYVASQNFLWAVRK